MACWRALHNETEDNNKAVITPRVSFPNVPPIQPIVKYASLCRLNADCERYGKARHPELFAAVRPKQDELKSGEQESCDVAGPMDE